MAHSGDLPRVEDWGRYGRCVAEEVIVGRRQSDIREDGSDQKLPAVFSTLRYASSRSRSEEQSGLVLVDCSKTRAWHHSEVRNAAMAALAGSRPLACGRCGVTFVRRFVNYSVNHGPPCPRQTCFFVSNEQDTDLEGKKLPPPGTKKRERPKNNAKLVAEQFHPLPHQERRRDMSRRMRS